MESLIINKRHELPRMKRWLWDIATLLLWMGWIYLWKPLIVVFYQILTLKAGPDEMADVILENISVIPFHHAIFMLIATPLVLFILSRLNRHKSSNEHLLHEASEYANHFKVDNARLQTCIKSQYITVHHDDHGHITLLENRIEKH